MKFTNLVDLPVKVTQITPHVYGEGLTPGCSVSCKALVEEGALSFSNEQKNFSLWEEADNGPSIFAKLLKKAEYAFEDAEGTLTIKMGDNKEILLETSEVSRLTVKEATQKKDRMIEFRFSVAFYNDAASLFAAQSCMKQEELYISTDLAA